SSKYPYLGVSPGKDKNIRILNLANLSGKGAPGNLGGELSIYSFSAMNLMRSNCCTWTNPADNSPWVFVTGNNGIAGFKVALDSSGNPSMSLQWSSLPGLWTTSAFVANNVLYAARGGGEHTGSQSKHEVDAINPTTGQFLWSGGIDEFHWASPILANGVLYMADGNSGSFSGPGGHLRAWALPSTPNNTYIAESLSYTTNGASASLQTDTNYNPPTWVELAATGTNQSITYTIPDVAAGTYQLQMEWKGNTSRGELSLSVDGGVPLTPDPLDQYSATQTYPTTTFSPNLTFSSTGNHTITLTVVGQDPSSTGFNLSTFAFILNPVTTFTGTYELQNETSGLALNVKGASTSNGAEVVQYPFVGGQTNSEWTFTPTTNGYYQIVSVKSGLDVAVVNASTATKALIDQWSFGTTGDDQWIPTQNSDGSFSFLNLNSGLALDDPGGSTSSDTQMDQYTDQGSTNQKWEVISQ
ncbi:MAG TPA: RICIN domain-containing protein, partial [Candidatus Methylacidiphilales bacterium]|nr:RICIN domain-containing protein [Candidatus Methylacidiphilales bacterium]